MLSCASSGSTLTFRSTRTTEPKERYLCTRRNFSQCLSQNLTVCIVISGNSRPTGAHRNKWWNTFSEHGIWSEFSSSPEISFTVNETLMGSNWLGKWCGRLWTSAVVLPREGRTARRWTSHLHYAAAPARGIECAGRQEHDLEAHSATHQVIDPIRNSQSGPKRTQISETRLLWRTPKLFNLTW